MKAFGKKNQRQGFSLIELVVVVLVMGIIAAVAGPRMFDTANDARESGTRSSLTVVRNAIELYRSQTGSFPGDGGTEADLKADLQNYIRGPFPEAQVGANAGDTVRVETSGSALTVSGTQSWAYDNSTGEFIVNDSSFSSW